MLEGMDAGQFLEWLAFWQIKDEDYKRAELTSRAEAGLKSHRRGGHR